ncbi:phage terminase small subunit P27 family [Eubacterium multiforme]|uniref:P27 family predicted phage terminase small subunit n=1 Tax=Eubacterium multiforme TaxID=83339 RepID=A0ABT9US46_9FIRM|nr:phage terminase small subunit P27 family [Eubacterium multiforme]MDQ0149134.1 P27 family predicted phage terminase small subunit [Eubacterium multiforme]
MARPCKSAKVLSECSQTKDEIQERIEYENKLRGNGDKIYPPKFLNENQRDVFNYIKDELKESGILSNLDIYILVTCSIAIERIQYLENKINDNNGLLFKSEIMSAKDKYSKDFYRCCNELSLSPQSRAKLSNINLNAKDKAEDPLLKALADDD